MTDTSNNFHFLAGLPRSGSTLLATLMRQNPQVRAGFTTPVGYLVDILLVAMSGKNEFHPLFSEEDRKRIILSIFGAVHEDPDPDITVIDTNRSWASKLPLLTNLFPHARMVALVRPVDEIIASFEKVFRSSPLDPSRMLQYSASENIYSRVDRLLNPSGVIGSAYHALKEAFYGEHADRLLIVRYNSLVQQPSEVLSEIYRWFGLPDFAHSFTGLNFSGKAFDDALGCPGLHDVVGDVKPRDRFDVVPPDIIKRCEALTFWEDASLNDRSVRVL